MPSAQVTPPPGEVELQGGSPAPWAWKKVDTLAERASDSLKKHIQTLTLDGAMPASGLFGDAGEKPEMPFAPRNGRRNAGGDLAWVSFLAPPGPMARGLGWYTCPGPRA